MQASRLPKTPPLRLSVKVLSVTLRLIRNGSTLAGATRLVPANQDLEPINKDVSTTENPRKRNFSLKIFGPLSSTFLGPVFDIFGPVFDIFVTVFDRRHRRGRTAFVL